MATPKILFRKLAELTPDPENARLHSPEQLEWIANSIERFGWTNPVMIVGSTVYAGSGRYAAAVAMGEAGTALYLAPGKERGGAPIPKGHIPAIDCTGWTEEERTAYALADNQLALQASWDEERLRGQLKQLSGADFSMEIIGFDTDSLAALAVTDPVVVDLGGKGGDLADSTFSHVDQYAVIIRCADAAEQEARFNRLRDEYGADQVKVVVV